MLKFLKKEKEIIAVMSEKKDGQMKLREKGHIRNRERFLSQFEIDSKDIISADLCHGKSVKIIRNNKQIIISKTDGLVTDRPGIFLAVTVADCLPIVFFEKKKKIIGVVHSGWKSAVKDIAKVAVEKIEKLGGNPKNLMVEIGPGIGECHFEIGKEILGHFKDYKKFVKIKGEKYSVDLKGIIKFQLEEKGIKKSNIIISKICTFCDKKYFSARRDKSKELRAGIMVVGMK